MPLSNPEITLVESEKWTVSAIVLISLGLFFLIGCEVPVPTKSKALEDIPQIYAPEVEPLTPEQCGQCHPQVYYLIKAEGGKHRIDCRQCHVKFHVYRPGVVQYKDILPKCGSCHEQVHGPDLAQCSECHTEPHAPLKIPAERALEQGCYICHPEEDREMKTYVTQHTELYCSSCHHTRHGYVPQCLECHQPHTEEMTQTDCLMCHPPHKALEVVYPEDISQETCASCHRNAYEILKKSGTKHTALTCAKCHPEHRAILRCQECHPQPHSVAMLQRFPVCGQCHGTAHDLIQTGR
jgi:hypothetical protein